jgi:2-dehydropantoate 2-reductase
LQTEQNLLARIGVFGAGAVGGTIGGLLSLAGRDVTLIGQWREHIAAIRKDGLRIVDAAGTRVAHPVILHHNELATHTQKFDVVLLCVKSYDTDWAVKAVAPHLAPQGFVASLQNGINEARIAAIVGTARTVGVGISTIGANATIAGEVLRTSSKGGALHTVFRAGEIDGHSTPRIEALVELLNIVDSAKVTDNLVGERWSKLVLNSITHGLAVATGLNSRALMVSQALRPLTIRLASEGVRVGRAQGFRLVDIYGAAADTWLAAERGDAAALAAIEQGLQPRYLRATEDERPSAALDVMRGRRSELEFTSGALVAKARELGMMMPAQEALYALTRRVERGEIESAPKNTTALA